MKKLLLFVSVVMGITLIGHPAQAQDTVRMLRVNHGGNVLLQVPVSSMDSIKTADRIATFYYGEASWSRNILNIDSITLNMVYNGDTSTYADTTAIDTSSHVIILWNGSNVTVTNPYATSGVTVSNSNGDVTVDAEAGIENIVYELRGTSTDGSLELNTDSKTIIILNGLTLTSASADAPTINLPDKKACVIHLAEGSSNYLTDGANNGGKSVFYNKGALTVQGGGTLTITSAVVNGLQGKGSVTINGGVVNVSVLANKAKGIKSDGNVTVNAGTVNITASGSVIIDTLTDGTYDMSYCSGIGTDADYVQTGGNVTVTIPASNAGGRGISADGNMAVSGGYLTITTAGAGSCVGGTGWNAFDGYTCCGMKADGNIVLTGGTISISSTGLGGRGIACDGNYIQGTNGGGTNDVHVHITTSGSPVNPLNVGRNDTTDYFKGLPKGLKVEGNIYIYSGHLASYCAQTSGDPNGEAIESKDSMFVYGGDIEANAYDDAINAANYLEVNGGRIWAYARGNDAIDCNGAYTIINGGLIIARGTENGIDAGTDAGGHFVINGGTVFCIGGNMGAWDTPTMSGTQKYLSLSNDGSNGLVIKNSAGDNILQFKNSTVTGSGFIDESTGSTGTKPPGGGGGGPQGQRNITFTSPDVTTGTYTVYTSATFSGGSSWHGYYTGSTPTVSGNSTSATATGK